jgi:DNA-binding PadR family transcriptional regulator
MSIRGLRRGARAVLGVFALADEPMTCRDVRAHLPRHDVRGWVLTLASLHLIEAAGRQMGRRRSRHDTLILWRITPEGRRRIGRARLGPEQLDLLDSLRDGVERSSGYLFDDTGRAPAGALRSLHKLTARGLVERAGTTTNPGYRWRITAAGLAELGVRR